MTGSKTDKFLVTLLSCIYLSTLYKVWSESLMLDVFSLQPNSERDPIEEMRAAEESGEFTYVEGADEHGTATPHSTPTETVSIISPYLLYF